jgi:hypothetical protein
MAWLQRIALSYTGRTKPVCTAQVATDEYFSGTKEEYASKCCQSCNELSAKKTADLKT